MTRQLLALGHKARSGKDTVAAYLMREYGFKKIAFADPLKKVVVAAFPGVTMDHVFDDSLKLKEVPFWPHETPARMLQRMAQGVRSEYGQDFWARIAQRKLEIDGFFEPGSEQRYVITDMRTPAEAALVKTWGGRTIRIDRPRALRGEIGRPENHWTEIALDDYDGWDAVVNNNSGSLDELHRLVDDRMLMLNIDKGRP